MVGFASCLTEPLPLVKAAINEDRDPPGQQPARTPRDTVVCATFSAKQGSRRITDVDHRLIEGLEATTELQPFELYWELVRGLQAPTSCTSFFISLV